MSKLIKGILTGTTLPFRNANGEYQLLDVDLVYKPYRLRDVEQKRKGYWLSTNVVHSSCPVNVDVTYLNTSEVHIFYDWIKQRSTRWTIKIR